jgi:hypothetical protein
MCCWSFNQLQADQIDPLYEERLLQERPVLVVKLLQSYQWCIENFITQGWPTVALTLPATAQWRDEMLNGSVSSHLLDTFFKKRFLQQRGFAVTKVRERLRDDIKARGTKAIRDLVPTKRTGLSEGATTDAQGRRRRYTEPNTEATRARIQGSFTLLPSVLSAGPATRPDSGAVRLHRALVESKTRSDPVRRSAKVRRRLVNTSRLVNYTGQSRGHCVTSVEVAAAGLGALCRPVPPP